MFSANGKREAGSGKQLIRVSRGATRYGPAYTLVEREVSHFPPPASQPLTWWQFMALSLAPILVGLASYCIVVL